MPAHSDTKYMIPSQPVFALSPYCCVFSREATYTNFIVFGIKVTTPFCFIFSRAWRWRNGIGKIIVSLQEKFEDTIYEAVIRSRKWKTDNTMAKIKSAKGQTTIYKIYMSSNGHGYKNIYTATNRIDIFCIKFRITTRVFYINLFLDQIDICDSRHRISPWKKLDRPYIKGDSKTRKETEKKSSINKKKRN